LASYYDQVLEGTTPTDIRLLMKAVMILNQVSLLTTSLEYYFGEITISKFSTNLVSLKMKNPGDKSIGFLTGLMQKVGKEYLVKDFDAKQTSLE
jgi:hypothetical protein